MTDERRTWMKAFLAVMVVTVTAVAVPVAAPLYATTYPTAPGGLDKLLTEAALHVGFDEEPLVQYRPTRFSATVVYAAPIPSGVPTVSIAYENDAHLKAPKREFRISPLTDSRQNLGEATVREDGARSLTWSWEVEPLVAGRRTLILEIQPFVLVDGKTVPDVQHRNKPIPVEVRVHRNERALDLVSAEIRQDIDDPAGAQRLVVDVPDETTAGRGTAVSAELNLGDTDDVLSADIDVSRRDGSVPLTITPGAAETEDGVVRRTWTVTPEEVGTASLLFDVKLTSSAGQHELQDVVSLQRDIRVNQTLWQSFVALAAAIGVILAAMVSFFVLWDRRRRRQSGNGSRERADPSP